MTTYLISIASIVGSHIFRNFTKSENVPDRDVELDQKPIDATVKVLAVKELSSTLQKAIERLSLAEIDIQRLISIKNLVRRETDFNREQIEDLAYANSLEIDQLIFERKRLKTEYFERVRTILQQMLIFWERGETNHFLRGKLHIAYTAAMLAQDTQSIIQVGDISTGSQIKELLEKGQISKEASLPTQEIKAYSRIVAPLV